MLKLRFAHIYRRFRQAILDTYRNKVHHADVLVQSDCPTFYTVKTTSQNSSVSKKLIPVSRFEDGRISISISTLKKISLTPHLSNFVLKTIMELKPPENVRGMKILDRSAFDQTIVVPALKVPVNNVGAVVKYMKKSVLKIVRVKPVVEISGENQDRKTHKIILLDPGKHSHFDSFSDEMKNTLEKSGVTGSSFDTFKINLTYDNWTIAEILKAILTSDAESVAGFSTIGHIAHLNLKDAHLEFKNIIGEIILDKLHSIKTVVNKTKTIDNTYRNFQMELLAGDDNMFASTKENGCHYEFDFSKVYWNPRLGTEHQRVIDQLSASDVVYDVFAGVGPFAIPAAKKLCEVYANDLNPESFKWLKHNVEKKNKIKVPIHVYNQDGREFIRSVAKTSIVKYSESDELHSNSRFCFLMNLPALAIEFLDAFVGLFADNALCANKIHIQVHCYGFTKADNAEDDIKTRIETVLMRRLPDSDTTVRFVRNVAPSKDMMCCSFKMPVEVLLGLNQTNTAANYTSEDEPVMKKAKVSDF